MRWLKDFVIDFIIDFIIDFLLPLRNLRRRMAIAGLPTRHRDRLLLAQRSVLRNVLGRQARRDRRRSEEKVFLRHNNRRLLFVAGPRASTGTSASAGPIPDGAAVLDVPLERAHPRARAESVHVGAGERRRALLGDDPQVHRIVDLELPGKGDEHLLSVGRRRRNADVQQLVQASGAQQRRVEQVWSVGGTDNEDVVAAAPGLRRVDLCEELRDDPVHDAARVGALPAARRETVELVEEDDARASTERMMIRRQWSG